MEEFVFICEVLVFFCHTYILQGDNIKTQWDSIIKTNGKTAKVVNVFREKQVMPYIHI